MLTLFNLFNNLVASADHPTITTFSFFFLMLRILLVAWLLLTKLPLPVCMHILTSAVQSQLRAGTLGICLFFLTSLGQNHSYPCIRVRQFFSINQHFFNHLPSIFFSTTFHNCLFKFTLKLDSPPLPYQDPLLQGLYPHETDALFLCEIFLPAKGHKILINTIQNSFSFQFVKWMMALSGITLRLTRIMSSFSVS